jgi:Fe-S-cluster containining protein
MATTILPLDALLPLTCTRAGTCCHGKLIWINPWELACLAAACGLTPAACAARSTVDGGIRLAATGTSRFAGRPACSLYAAERGCSVHAARPLACRLYPLGRIQQGDQVHYIHEGSAFPCLAECPTVVNAEHLRVDAYLAQQGVEPGVAAQTAYLPLVSALAQAAFEVLVDLPETSALGARRLAGWRRMVGAGPGGRSRLLPDDWLGLLITPAIAAPLAEPAAWVEAHATLIIAAAEERCARASAGHAGAAQALALADASTCLFGAALHLAASLGGDGAEPGRTWLARAEQLCTD